MENINKEELKEIIKDCLLEAEWETDKEIVYKFKHNENTVFDINFINNRDKLARALWNLLDFVRNLKKGYSKAFINVKLSKDDLKKFGYYKEYPSEADKEGADMNVIDPWLFEDELDEILHDVYDVMND